MIAVELGNGKTIFMKVEEWLDLTPSQFQDLIAKNEGYDIDNPFDKVLNRIKDDRDDYTIDTPEIPDELPTNIVLNIDGSSKKSQGEDNTENM